MQRTPLVLAQSTLRSRWATAFTACALFVSLSPDAAHSEPLITGGSTPFERPEEAPTITKFGESSQVLESGLQGVSKPYPSSLMFLKDQGAWYSPFLRPGMARPYDLRNLRKSDPTTTQEVVGPASRPDSGKASR